MKALLILALAIPLTACSSEPPACVNESFFYNDVPGCPQALATWKKKDPKSFEKWSTEEARKRKKMTEDLMGAIFKGVGQPKQ